MNILLLVSVEKAAQCACCRGGKSSRLVLGQLGLSTTSQLERSVCKPTIDLCTNKLGEGAPKETSLHTAWPVAEEISDPQPMFVHQQQHLVKQTGDFHQSVSISGLSVVTNEHLKNLL